MTVEGALFRATKIDARRSKGKRRAETPVPSRFVNTPLAPYRSARTEP